MLAKPGILSMEDWASKLVGQLEDKIREYDTKLQELTAVVTYELDLNDGLITSVVVPVEGASLGDFTEATFSLPLEGITISSWVSDGGEVTVQFENWTGGNLAVGEGTLNVKVRQP